MSSLIEGEKRINFELFEAYKQIYGNVHIRADFIVPFDDERWPIELRGLKLGNLAERIRINLKKVGYYNFFDVEKLLEMGFKLYFREHKIDSILLAFKTYKDLYGHCKVNRSFVVGEEDEKWPDECRGMLLGETLHGIRNKKLHKPIHDELIALGVDLEDHPRFIGQAFERVFEALSTFKSVHGHLDVPRDFVVPKSEPYPPRAYGCRLGSALFSIKAKGKFLEHRAELESLGMVFHGKKHPGFETTLAAFKAYKERYGDLRVPKKFVVPSDDPLFPPESWGLRLGNSLQSIRNHSAHREHKEEFQALGLVFEARKRRRVSANESASSTQGVTDVNVGAIESHGIQNVAITGNGLGGMDDVDDDDDDDDDVSLASS